MTDKKIYFDNLDGLRCIAFLSVFIGHIFSFNRLKIDSHVINRIIGHFFAHGDLGVNFFFVLSGFLITFLLLEEKKENKTIAIKKFYMRRILRIWPVYFLTIGIGFFIIPFLFSQMNPAYLPFAIDIPLSKMGWYAGFVVNFDMIFNGPNYLIVVVLWSVSVEEQYYLFWPLINRIASKYIFAFILLLLLILSYYYRWVYYYDKGFIKYSTFSVMNDLVLGSAVALGVFSSEKFKRFFIHINRSSIFFIYVLFLICIPLRGFIYYFSETTDRFLVSLEPFVFSLFFAFIILEQNYSKNSLFKISKIKSFTYLGKISYGLYCYHMIFIFLMSVLFNWTFGQYVETSVSLFILQSVLSFVLTMSFSHISYHFYEKWFLKIKKRYAS